MNAAGCEKFELVSMVKFFEFLMLIRRRSASTIASAMSERGSKTPRIAQRGLHGRSGLESGRRRPPAAPPTDLRRPFARAQLQQRPVPHEKLDRFTHIGRNGGFGAWTFALQHVDDRLNCTAAVTQLPDDGRGSVEMNRLVGSAFRDGSLQFVKGLFCS